jgi:hypothetical protein
VLAVFVAVLEVELVLPRLLHGHGQDQPIGLGRAGDRSAELLVDEQSGARPVRTFIQPAQEPLEDDVLRIGDPFGLLRRGLPRDAEELLLERAAVVERQDV